VVLCRVAQSIYYLQGDNIVVLQALHRAIGQADANALVEADRSLGALLANATSAMKDGCLEHELK
jgi:hypothetical protein